MIPRSFVWEPPTGDAASTQRSDLRGHGLAGTGAGRGARPTPYLAKEHSRLMEVCIPCAAWTLYVPCSTSCHPVRCTASLRSRRPDSQRHHERCPRRGRLRAPARADALQRLHRFNPRARHLNGRSAPRRRADSQAHGAHRASQPAAARSAGHLCWPLPRRASAPSHWPRGESEPHWRSPTEQRMCHTPGWLVWECFPCQSHSICRCKEA